MTAVLHVITWILIIIGLVIAAIVFIAAAVLFSTITANIAVNNHKALITLDIWYVVRHTFEIRFDKIVSDEKEEAESKAEAAEESADEKPEKWFGLIDKAELKNELVSLWDKESFTFDFQLLYDIIEKYTKLLNDCKYGIGRVFKCLRYKVRLKRLDLYVRYGTGEPDKTGIAYGAMYGGVGALTPILDKYVKMKRAPRLFLEPDYVHKVFGFEAGCVVKTRLIHFVKALIVGYVSYKLRRKNK